MLIAATAIFVYYTVWTLFMVRKDLPLNDIPSPADLNFHYEANSFIALRRRGPRPALALPPPRLGHTHPCDSDHPLHHGRRLVPLRCYDKEQPQEGTQGPAEEGIVGDTS